MEHEDKPERALSAGRAGNASSINEDADYRSASPEALKKLIDQLPGAVYRCTYDTEWTSLYMGAGFQEMCGLAPDALDPDGRSFKEVVVPDDLDRIRTAVGNAVQDHTYYSVEYRIRTDAGAVRWVQDNGRPHFNAEGEVTWLDGILFDVTKRKEAEQSLQHTERDLEDRVRARTDKLRELSTALTIAEQRERNQIAYTIHDNLLQYLYGIQVQLRMFVNGIRSQSNLDLDRLSVTPDQVDSLMEQAIEAARQLTIDLAPPVLETDGIMEALQWLRSHLKDYHDFTVHLPRTAPDITCTDEVRTILFRVIRELLINACEYAEVDAAHVSIAVENDYLHIEVVDNGSGFDAEKAFNRDAQGFGLWKARERLRSFDGRLGIDTQPGEGTRCTISVPTDSLSASATDLS